MKTANEWARALAVSFLGVIGGLVTGASLMAGENGVLWATIGLTGMALFGMGVVWIVNRQHHPTTPQGGDQEDVLS